MNAMSKKLKDEKTWGNVKSCSRLLPKVVSIFEVLEFIKT
jgi:hypothetical protein